MQGFGKLLGYLVIPALGVAADLYLLVNLDGHALTLGAVWWALGFAYLVYLTKGFRMQPPEMHFTEA